VDDSESPATEGTGTEDFFNGGWYFENGTFTLPTHGNTAHAVIGTNDCTAAYRFFLQDAIPFRKHLRAGIQHGAVDLDSENVWTLAYYYWQPINQAVLTDQLAVGNAGSEGTHGYSISNETWNGSRTFEYEGMSNTLNITDTGRAHQGYSQFTMAIQPGNAGAILRRRLDQGVANQEANVYVNGVLVGPWYRAGGNTVFRWRDDDFMIPASYTSATNALQIKLQFLSSFVDWNEFYYSLYSLQAISPAPQATAQTVSGYANHDLAIALSGTDSGENPLSYRVTALPAVGALYQFSGGSRGAAISSANTSVMDGSGRIVFAPELNQTGTPYAQIGFVANDGINDSLPAEVVVNMLLPSVPRSLMCACLGSWTNRTFNLTFEGSSNATYSVWISTNFAQWTLLSTAAEISPGQYELADPVPASSSRRFYRVQAP